MRLTEEQQKQVVALLPRVTRWANRWGRGDDDLTSLAHLSLCEFVAKYDAARHRVSLRTYCWRRIRDKVIRALLRKRRMVLETDLCGGSVIDRIPAPSIGDGGEMYLCESLPPHLHRVAIEKFVRGRGVNAIEKLTGIKRVLVRKHLKEARERLAQCRGD